MPGHAVKIKLTMLIFPSRLPELNALFVWSIKLNSGLSPRTANLLCCVLAVGVFESIDRVLDACCDSRQPVRNSKQRANRHWERLRVYIRSAFFVLASCCVFAFGVRELKQLPGEIDLPLKRDNHFSIVLAALAESMNRAAAGKLF